MQKRKKLTTHGLLLLLCWAVYTCSLIGKVNYSANVTLVESFYGVTHARAGVVSTFYFFAYGVGQIVNGLCCKKYNLKYVIFGSALLSGLANLAVGITPSFPLIKYFWLINGVALSVLWPGCIRLLSETLTRKEMTHASVFMGTTTAVGTFIVYGLSALYAKIANFRFSFYTAAIVLPTMGIVWLLSYNRLTVKTPEVLAEEAEITQKAQTEQGEERKGKMPVWLLSTVCVLASFAVATNLVKDGLVSWVPAILKEQYGITDSLSILLTLALPTLSIFGNIMSVTTYKKVGNFVGTVGLFFFGIVCLTGAVLGLLHTNLVVLTIICFACISFMASSCNSTITSVFPLCMKGKLNSGMIAGVLNGFCYIGSTISTYGLGVIADTWGWTAVFYLLLGVSALVVAVALVFILLGKKKLCKQNVH